MEGGDPYVQVHKCRTPPVASSSIPQPLVRSGRDDQHGHEDLGHPFDLDHLRLAMGADLPGQDCGSAATTVEIS